MSVHYVEIAVSLAIAVEITGLDNPTLIRATKVDLAESALHAPAAGFGETKFYPDFIDKAAVYASRITIHYRTAKASSVDRRPQACPKKESAKRKRWPSRVRHRCEHRAKGLGSASS